MVLSEPVQLISSMIYINSDVYLVCFCSRGVGRSLDLKSNFVQSWKYWLLVVLNVSMKLIHGLVRSAVCFTFVPIENFAHVPRRVHLPTIVIKAAHLLPYAQGMFMDDITRCCFVTIHRWKLASRDLDRCYHIRAETHFVHSIAHQR